MLVPGWCCVLLCSLFAVAVEAEELGRLFTTPEQRGGMRHSKQDGGDALPASPPLPQPAPVPVPRSVSTRLRGIVYRQDGRHTVWLNGVSAYLAESPPPGLRMLRPDAVRMHSQSWLRVGRQGLPYVVLPLAQ